MNSSLKIHIPAHVYFTESFTFKVYLTLYVHELDEYFVTFNVHLY